MVFMFASILIVGGILMSFLPLHISTDANNRERIKFTHISAGRAHSLAIADDGRLFAWGLNSNGQLGLPSTVTIQNTPRHVGGNLRFSAISAGGYHSLALDKNGNLYSFGLGTQGQLASGVNFSRNTITRVQGMAFSSIEAGHAHSFAITTDGRLFASGNNNAGQLGIGGNENLVNTTENTNTLTYVQTSENIRFSSVSTMGGGLYGHTLAIAQDGRLFSWGRNFSGQLGDGFSGDRDVPVHIIQGSYFIHASAGGTHSIVVRADGYVLGFGENTFGQLGNLQTAGAVWNPISVPRYDVISSGGSHSVGIENSRLFAWGGNNHMQVESSSNNHVFKRYVGEGRGFSTATAGVNHTLALTTDGRLFSWGDNRSRQLGANIANVATGSPIEVFVFEDDAPPIGGGGGGTIGGGGGSGNEYGCSLAGGLVAIPVVIFFSVFAGIVVLSVFMKKRQIMRMRNHFRDGNQNGSWNNDQWSQGQNPNGSWHSSNWNPQNGQNNFGAPTPLENKEANQQPVSPRCPNCNGCIDLKEKVCKYCKSSILFK